MLINLPDGIKIYYNVNGKENKIDISQPVLIVLHGGPGLADHTLYVPFWSKLQDIIQVVFIDSRGHGRSGGRDDTESWTLERWGKDIYDFCQALNIKRPIIAGISFGGWVALSYATQYPNHALGLLLCHTEAKIEPEIRKQAYARKARLLGKDSDKIVNVVQRIFDWESGEVSRELYIKYCLPLYSSHPYDANTFKKCIPNSKVWDVFGKKQHEFDFLPSLHKIESQALVLTGELDPEHPPEFSKAMARKLRHGKLKIIKGAGVPAYQDKEEETFRILEQQIQDWLKLSD